MTLSPKIMDVKAFIFDLDGVIVETSSYHYEAWKRIAFKANGYHLTKEDNDLLKGVSRIKSLDIILDLANATVDQELKDALLIEKNEDYLDLIKDLKQKDLLSGALDFLEASQQAGIKIGLGSASKNARLVLEATDIIQMFEAIVDGTNVIKGKPDPEVFLKGADLLGFKPNEIVVFEDALKGVQAAKAGGFHSVGINIETKLTAFNLSSFENITPHEVIERIQNQKK